MSSTDPDPPQLPDTTTTAAPPVQPPPPATVVAALPDAIEADVSLFPVTPSCQISTHFEQEDALENDSAFGDDNGSYVDSANIKALEEKDRDSNLRFWNA